ncbi:transmembrane protein 176 [Solea solea]|uniref:transmembrane protein 176 n=1 Tax=Solea solea TaxID=90069 RepID=UPI00272C05CF|nr:transmembrane protein 176 [Solea solea]
MAVSVSRDLTVQVQEDVNAVKLTDRQQLLHAAVQRGEPKSLGVSQVMLGLMVISYSLPLLLTNVTDVVRLGVPWWSGLMFITAGVVAIVLDKHCNLKILQTCLAASALSIVLSLVAVIIYSVDMQKNPVVPCRLIEDHCQDLFYATKLSIGLKSSLLLFTLAQMSISACQCFLLFRQRHNFGQYSSLTEGAPSTPQALIPPNLH